MTRKAISLNNEEKLKRANTIVLTILKQIAKKNKRRLENVWKKLQCFEKYSDTEILII